MSKKWKEKTKIMDREKISLYLNLIFRIVCHDLQIARETLKDLSREEFVGTVGAYARLLFLQLA